MKKSIFRIALFTLLAVSFIYACTPTVEATPTSLASAYLSIEYSDAANVRSQLAYGTLKLADTPNVITPDQAKTLIPLWQAVISLSGDTTTASEELTAVQDQITAAMTKDQLQAISEMKITNAGLNEFYAQYGVSLPTPVPGVTKVPGSGSGKTEEEKAASQATAAALGQTTGTGQSAKTLLFEKTVEYLMGAAEQ
ncbi:MAG: hypothetical protein IPN58_12370 [Anaerolineales bacterium]|jgi:hypothetical protein|nr:hypothetical protein [Anaerolineales bacterium]